MYHFKEREKFTKAAKYFEEHDYDLRFIDQIAFPSPAKNGGLLINFFGIEYFNRYYSIYPGMVYANHDPEQRCRLMVIVPAVSGNDFINHWALPFGMPAGDGIGAVHIPKKGEQVWVMFDHGDPTKPIWAHGWYATKEQKIDKSYPNNYTYTTGKHTVSIDEKEQIVTIKNDKTLVEIDSQNNAFKLSLEGGKKEIILYCPFLASLNIGLITSPSSFLQFTTLKYSFDARFIMVFSC